MDYPIRQHSAHTPKPKTSIERVCRSCGASFIGLAPGKTGERGIWTEAWVWSCSVECHERPNPRNPVFRPAAENPV